MKWLSAGLILGCGVWMAAALSRGLTARCEEITQMLTGWTRLGERVMIYADRLGEASIQAVGVTRGPVKDVFDTFAAQLSEPNLADPDTAWKQAMDAQRSRLHLSREESAELCALAQNIGPQSMEEQRHGFSDILCRLDRMLKRAQQAKKVGTGLWARWCVLIAAAAAIAVL